MSSMTTIFREDAEFLREFVKRRQHQFHSTAHIIGQEDVDRLEEIAAKLEIFADANVTPTQRLEGQVEEALAECAEGWVNDTESTEGLLAALWFLSRRIQAAGGKSLLGQGLAGLGVGAIASLFGRKEGGE